MSTELTQLSRRWRSEAALLRRYGDERGATACELHAAELESAIHSVAAEVLTLAAAARESGYTRAHLRRMIREDQLPNAGSDTEPLILRAYLPRKPGAGIAAPARLMPSSRTQVARAVASQGGE